MSKICLCLSIILLGIKPQKPEKLGLNLRFFSSIANDYSKKYVKSSKRLQNAA